MQHVPYLPTNKEELLVWIQNFAAKKAAHAVLFGFTTPQVSSSANDAGYAAYVIGLPDAIALKYSTSVHTRDIFLYKLGDPTPDAQVYTIPTAPTPVAPGIVKRCVADINTMIGTGKFDAAMQTEFMAVGAEIIFLEDDFIASMTDKVFTDKIEFEFSRKNIDGIYVYSKRPGETSFSFLDKVNKSPCTDSRPLAVAGTAENRQYYCQAFINDIRIGHPSPVYHITFGGPIT